RGGGAAPDPPGRRPAGPPRRSSSRSASPRSLTRSSAPRAAGSRGATPPSPTSTRPPEAATSPPGKSPSCLRPRSGRRSSRCADRRPAGAPARTKPGGSRAPVAQSMLPAASLPAFAFAGSALSAVLAQARRPGLEVAPLGKARGPARRAPVALAGGGAITRHLQQMRTDGIEAMVAGDAAIAVKPAQELEPGVRAAHHRKRDGAVEGDHRVRRDALEERVKGKDLGPVGVLRAGRFIVDRGDGRL